MSPRNTILRHEKDDSEKLMAKMEERRRWMDRFDLWLFLSVWIVITTVAGLGIVLHN